MHRAALAAFCAAASLSISVATAAAQDPYYKGKRLTVLINFAAGGPTDIEGRLFAKYLAKHLEGSPNVIVQNMDGAGGVVGAQFVGEVAPKDGTVMGYFAGTSWIYVSDPSRWRVDFKSYEFLTYTAGTTVHFVRTDVSPGLKVPTDIVKAKGLVAGGLSIDTSKDLRMRLGLDMLGVPFKYVTGYRSSAPARLAFQRGEINLFSESPPSYRAMVIPGLVDKGLAIPVWWDDVHEGDKPEPQKQMEGLDVPTFPQLHRKIKGTMPSGKMWQAYKTLFEVNSTLQRLLALPPGAPRAAYDALSAAIGRLNNDKEFDDEAMKVIKFVPEYPVGPGMKEKIRNMMSASPEMIKYINDYTKNVPKR